MSALKTGGGFKGLECYHVSATLSGPLVRFISRDGHLALLNFYSPNRTSLLQAFPNSSIVKFKSSSVDSIIKGGHRISRGSLGALKGGSKVLKCGLLDNAV